MKEEVLIGLVQLAQVVGIGVERLARPDPSRAIAQPAHEDVGRRLQIDHQIGRRDVLREQIVETLIDEQLVVVEIQIREDLVLVEQVVADRRLREEIALLQPSAAADDG